MADGSHEAVDLNALLEGTGNEQIAADIVDALLPAATLGEKLDALTDVAAGLVMASGSPPHVLALVVEAVRVKVSNAALLDVNPAGSA